MGKVNIRFGATPGADAIALKEISEARSSFVDLNDRFINTETLLAEKATKGDIFVNVLDNGCKCDANYKNNSDGKYYSDSGYTKLATDDSAALQALINSLASSQEKIIVIPKNMCLNSPVNVPAYTRITGITAGYYNNHATTIVTNASTTIDSFFWYDSNPGGQWHGASIERLYMLADNKVNYGIKIAGMAETSTIKEVVAQKFNQAGIQIYATTAPTNIENVSLFDNLYGLELYNGFGCHRLKGISGDRNTALIRLKNDSGYGIGNGYGNAVFISGIKAEGNQNGVLIDGYGQNATVRVEGHFQPLALTNPFVVTLQNCGTVPCIEMFVWASGTMGLISDSARSVSLPNTSNGIGTPILYGNQNYLIYDGEGNVIFNTKNLSTGDSSVSFLNKTVGMQTISATTYLDASYFKKDMVLIDCTGIVPTSISLTTNTINNKFMTLRRIDTDSSKTVYFNPNGGTLYKSDGTTTTSAITIACGQTFKYFVVGTNKIYQV